jgi:sortase A
MVFRHPPPAGSGSGEMLMKREKIGILLVLMLFIGVCGLLYPSVSQYWNSKTQTRAVENYQAILDSLKEEDYSAFFQEAERYNKALNELKDHLADYRDLEGYDRILNVSGNGIMGYVAIPKLSVELPVYHGISPEVLNIACGHLEGTSLPVGGENTHCVLSAHRGLPHAKLFTELDKMELGDTFTVTVLDQTVTYQVDQIKVVRPNEIDDVRIVGGQDLCTLLTCTPYGINSHRLLVRGRRIENAPPVLYVTSDAYRIDSLVATPIVAAPILFVLLIVLMVKYRDKGSKPLISKEEDEWLQEQWQ